MAEYVTQIDSSNVCQYVRIANATISEEGILSNATIAGIQIEDKFNMGLQDGTFAYVDAIVMITWDTIQLWCVAQEQKTSEMLNLEIPNVNRKYLYYNNGILLIYSNGLHYTILGEKYAIK